MVWAEHGTATAEKINTDANVRIFIVHPTAGSTIADQSAKFRVR
jgi:hypothetical protein